MSDRNILDESDFDLAEPRRPWIDDDDFARVQRAREFTAAAFEDARRRHRCGRPRR